jgi:integrase
MKACKQERGLYGIRDTAIIALSFSYNLKPPAAAALNLEDFDVTVGILSVYDQKGEAKTLCLDDETDRNLFNWLKIHGWEPGPMFWPITIGGKVKPRRMTFHAVRAVVLKRAEQAGLMLAH